MISIDDAVFELQDSYERGDPEYGISDDDAATGLRRVFKAAGIEYDDDYGRRREEEERARKEREAARLAAMTPEERERYQRSPFPLTAVDLLNSHILDSVFDSNLVFVQGRKYNPGGYNSGEDE